MINLIYETIAFFKKSKQQNSKEREFDNTFSLI